MKTGFNKQYTINFLSFYTYFFKKTCSLSVFWTINEYYRWICCLRYKCWMCSEINKKFISKRFYRFNYSLSKQLVSNLKRKFNLLIFKFDAKWKLNNVVSVAFFLMISFARILMMIFYIYNTTSNINLDTVSFSYTGTLTSKTSGYFWSSFRPSSLSIPIQCP